MTAAPSLREPDQRGPLVRGVGCDLRPARATASLTMRCTNCRLSAWVRPICGTVMGPCRRSRSRTARTPTETPSTGSPCSTLRRRAPVERADQVEHLGEAVAEFVGGQGASMSFTVIMDRHHDTPVVKLAANDDTLVVMTAASELNFFASADGDLAYRDAGTGDPVVLLHAGFVDHRIFDDQITGPRRRLPRHRPGHPRPRLVRQRHQALPLGRRPRRLLRHLDAGPAVLVGLSMGGAVADRHRDGVSGTGPRDRRQRRRAPATFRVHGPRVRSTRPRPRATARRQATSRAGSEHCAPGRSTASTARRTRSTRRHPPPARDWPSTRSPSTHRARRTGTSRWPTLGPRPEDGRPGAHVNGAADRPDMLAAAERLADTVRERPLRRPSRAPATTRTWRSRRCSTRSWSSSCASL